MPDLVVFIEGRLAGEITATNEGRAAMFRYDRSYLAGGRSTPLSLSAPLGSGEHNVTLWIDGLLPDSVQARRKWADRVGARSASAMDLLGTPIGLDCAGAVQFCLPGDEECRDNRSSGLEPQGEREVAEWIRRVRRDWSDWSGVGTSGRFSLAGAQPKCALHWDGSQWCVPYGNTPTTHILKPGMASHTDAEAVEHVCMTAARNLGIDTALTDLARFESERVLVVTRFDRVRSGDVLHRRHNEDLCQALGLSPAEKYQIDGGPTPRDVGDLLFHEASESRDARRRFCDALIFSWAIAATDGHAKNYSLLLDGPDVHLAPLYDVISFLPYAPGDPEEISTAMATGDDRTWRTSSRPSAWAAVAEALRLDADAVVDRAAEIMRGTPSAISDAIDNLPDEDRASQALPLLHGLSQRLADKALGSLVAGRMRLPRSDGWPPR